MAVRLYHNFALQRIGSAERSLCGFLSLTELSYLMCLAQLHIGGLVAVGIDPSGRYLLTVSHSGRGVYDTLTWRRVARDIELAYPVEGRAQGIGPLAGQIIPVQQIDYDTSRMTDAVVGPFLISYGEGDVFVKSAGPEPAGCD